MDLIRELEIHIDSLNLLIEDCQSCPVSIVSDRGIVSIKKMGNTELLKILLQERSATLTQLAFLTTEQKNKLLKELNTEEQLRLI